MRPVMSAYDCGMISIYHTSGEPMRGYVDAILWVLADNPRARAFYEREGWALDGGEKTDQFLGVDVRELRYRRAMRD